MSIHELVQHLRSMHWLSKAEILDVTTYRSRSIIKHMFIVLRLKQSHTECWLQLDRRAEDPLDGSFIFPSMRGPAQDVVRYICSLDLHTW